MDEIAREKLKTIGYVAFFRLNNGFEKILYMTNEQLYAHAKKFSKSFSGNILRKVSGIQILSQWQRKLY